MNLLGYQNILILTLKKRKEAKNDFEKDYFRLMNNAVFGKTLENLRKRINLKLTSNEDIYTNHASRANFISGKMFNEILFAINRIKEELVLNRPIYVGMAKKYDRKKVNLMITDTDGHFYEMKTDNVYKDLLQDSKIKNYLIIVITQKTVSSFFF